MKTLRTVLATVFALCLCVVFGTNAKAAGAFTLIAESQQEIQVYSPDQEFAFEVSYACNEGDVTFNWYEVNQSGSYDKNKSLGNGQALLIYGIPEELMSVTQYYICIAVDAAGNQAVKAFSATLVPIGVEDDSFFAYAKSPQDVTVYSSSEEFAFEVDVLNVTGEVTYNWVQIDAFGMPLNHTSLGNGQALLMYGIPEEKKNEKLYYQCVAYDNGSNSSYTVVFTAIYTDKPDPLNVYAVSPFEIVVNSPEEEFAFEVGYSGGTGALTFKWLEIDASTGLPASGSYLGNGPALLIYGIKEEDAGKVFYYMCTISDEAGTTKSIMFNCRLELPAEPSKEPTKEPSAEPSTEPTKEPTKEATTEPTKEATAEPAEAPTEEPVITTVPSLEPAATQEVTDPDGTVIPNEYPTETPTPATGRGNHLFENTTLWVVLLVLALLAVIGGAILIFGKKKDDKKDDAPKSDN